MTKSLPFFAAIATTVATAFFVNAKAPIQSSGPPIGSIIAYGGTTPLPSGYLLCDGSTIGTDQFPALFQVLRNSWGVAGTVRMFKLPDLRGTFLRGVTLGSANDPDVNLRTPNGNGDRNATGSLQGDQVALHSHDVRMSFGNPFGFDNFDYVGGPLFRQPPANKILPTSSYGGSETRPRNAYVQYIIRAK